MYMIVKIQIYNNKKSNKLNKKIKYNFLTVIANKINFQKV